MGNRKSGIPALETCRHIKSHKIPLNPTRAGFVQESWVSELGNRAILNHIESHFISPGRDLFKKIGFSISKLPPYQITPNPT